MVQKRKSGSKGDIPDARLGGKFGDFQFVRHTLTRDEKNAFKEWEIVPQDLWPCLDEMMDDGYKLSLAWDDYNHAITASLTCRGGNSGNQGLILTARSGDCWEALTMLVFKHEVLLKRDWTAFRPGAEGEPNYG